MSEQKIAFFDVENAPSLGWFYDPYKENNIVATEQPWFMLSFSWKHPGEKKIHDHALPDYPGYKRDKTNDRRLIEDLWKLFDSHDTLIGHNIGRFDCRKATSRFLNWGMRPPSPCVILDSLKEVRKLSYEDSNRLGALSTKWGFGDKLPTQGWDTWRGCIEGNLADWRVLRRYGKVDCLRAEQVWGVIAPWKKSYGHATGRMCPSPTCGSLNINSRGPVRGGPKHQFTCLTCGHWWTAKPGAGHESTSGRRSGM